MKLIKQFASLVKMRRKQLSLSQEKLAIKIYNKKNQKQFISQLERGVITGLTLDTIERISEALEIDIYLDVYKREDEKAIDKIVTKKIKLEDKLSNKSQDDDDDDFAYGDEENDYYNLSALYGSKKKR